MESGRWSEAIGRLGRIAFDSDAMIYYLEGQQPYRDMVREVVRRIEQRLATGIVAATVELEVLVKPLRERRGDVGERFDLLLAAVPTFLLRSVDREIARAAAALRARTSMAAMDAVVAATALVERCDAIIGNDRGFARRSEVRYLLLDDYAG